MNRILRRLDKLSLQIFLEVRAWFFRPQLKEEEGGVLILADLLLGDLAMAGYLIQAVRAQHPHREITLLHKANLGQVARLFKVNHFVAGEYLGWKAWRSLKAASPDGYGWVINVFSWKWLPMIYGLDIGRISSHAPGKQRSNYMLRNPHRVPAQPTAAPDIIFQLLDQAISIPQVGIHSEILPITEAATKMGSYVVVHIGASSIARLWPIQLLEFIVSTLQNLGATVVLTGLRQSDAYMKSMEELLACFPSSRVLNQVGRTSLIELISLIHGAQGLISVDTGVIHWGRLMGTPTFSLLGQSDVQLFGVNSNLFASAMQIDVPELPCRDKHTFHGIPIKWMQTCSRAKCIYPDVKCLTQINLDDIELKLTCFFQSDCLNRRRTAASVV